MRQASAWLGHLANPPLAATFAIGFLILFTFIGTFMRGPYWHFYWPWQAWPEIPARI